MSTISLPLDEHQAIVATAARRAAVRWRAQRVTVTEKIEGVGDVVFMPSDVRRKRLGYRARLALRLFRESSLVGVVTPRWLSDAFSPLFVDVEGFGSAVFTSPRGLILDEMDVCIPGAPHSLEHHDAKAGATFVVFPRCVAFTRYKRA